MGVLSGQATRDPRPVLLLQGSCRKLWEGPRRASGGSQEPSGRFLEALGGSQVSPLAGLCCPLTLRTEGPIPGSGRGILRRTFLATDSNSNLNSDSNSKL